MNQKQLYLAWVRTHYPAVYMQTLRTITGKKRSLGGLTDNLMDVAFSPDVQTWSDSTQVPQDVFDTITVSASPDPYAPAPLTAMDPSQFQSIGVDSVVNAGGYLAPSPFDTSSWVAPTITPAAPTPAPSGGWFNSFLNAATQIGTTLIKSNAQNTLLQTNTARARAGLPPLNAMGVPVSAAGLGPASSQILALERSIAGSTGGFGGVFLFSIAALGALLIFSGKRK